MPELIAIVILISSLLGIAIIIIRKIPLLAKLPIRSTEEKVLILKLKQRLKNFPGLKSFSYELLLQKILSRIRIWTMKTENKTSHWLEKLRQKSNQKNNFNNADYWEELKKAKKGE